MNFKDWAIPKLRELPAKEASIAHNAEQISLLRERYGLISATDYDKDTVQGGASMNPQEDKMLANVFERQMIEKDLELTKKEIKLMKEVLAELTDEERRILDVFFIHRQAGAVGIICDEFNFERSEAYRRKDRALENFARRLKGHLEV